MPERDASRLLFLPRTEGALQRARGLFGNEVPLAVHAVVLDA
ncbi:MAG TPA: hypothetical protein VKH65_14635 [Myxococcales bacterium]|nr:hypothetical protein [Myxococcales bacterium]